MVFHECPHSQNHLSSFRSDQPQSGQRMRELDVSRSRPTSRSGTMAGLSAAAIFEAIRIHFQRDRLVASTIQKSVNLKLGKSWDAEWPILLDVHEFVEQQAI